MALVSHVEGEEGGVVGLEVFRQPVLQVREKHIVIGHVCVLLHELVVVVVREEVVIQA